MRRIRLENAIGLVVVLTAVVPVRADLSVTTLPGQAESCCRLSVGFDGIRSVSDSPVCRVGYDCPLESLVLSADQLALLVPNTDTVDGANSDTGKSATLEMPATPGSAALFLSAMASLGAYQLVRSARHLNLTDVPAWYHTGGPVQVGHAVPLDLTFATPLLCRFEEPVGEPASRHRITIAPGVLRAQRIHPTTGAPRAPPALQEDALTRQGNLSGSVPISTEH